MILRRERGPASSSSSSRTPSPPPGLQVTHKAPRVAAGPGARAAAASRTEDASSSPPPRRPKRSRSPPSHLSSGSCAPPSSPRIMMVPEVAVPGRSKSPPIPSSRTSSAASRSCSSSSSSSSSSSTDLLPRGPLAPPAPEGAPACPTCGRLGLLKPDAIYFGEKLDSEVGKSAKRIFEECNAALIVGSSCRVSPAALLPVRLLKRGGIIVEVNPEGSLLSGLCAAKLRGPSAQVLPRLAQAMATLQQETVEKGAKEDSARNPASVPVSGSESLYD
eukprot:gnl/TRDRNA2_/TRDRNA2_175928_c3_seq1.p1 gnl/TRDRNA2_/TRDRNA2_175928_c3~~gnl/TRDRNA2_/TRDRNA2_175928_c3_seq1.p1  ORF type:complete len:275 (-),score=35.91 gnl/TRDRNA2_/TRDRNA2_175928_c3_seq1:205-1029(-)